MANEINVTRNDKISGANAVMDQGYITERDIPAMMEQEYGPAFVLEVQDELQLRSLTVPVMLETFHYYMGRGSIIYDPERLNADEAKEVLRLALGYKK